MLLTSKRTLEAFIGHVFHERSPALAGSCFIRWEKNSLDNKTVENITCVIIYISVCGRQNNDPRVRLVLIPRTYQYVGLHGKAELRLQMELRLLIS